MPGARFRFFGLPCVELGGVGIPLGHARAMQLLAHLAVTGGWLGRDHVAQLFWPGSSQKVARSNLRNLLSRMPAAASFASIETTEHLLRLKVPCDVQDFDAALQARDWALAARIGADELLQGHEHLASVPYLAWLQAERDLRLGQWCKAVRALLADAARPVAEREALAESWARRCPLDEEAVRACVALAHERGQPAAAQRLYRAFESRLRADLGVPPSAGLERLAMHPAPLLPGPAAAPMSAHAAIVGRRLELHTLATLLQAEDTRLVTVTGPGGVGKSTLLAAFHRQCLAAGSEDAFLVDVSAAPDTPAVFAGIAAALGIAGTPGTADEATLTDALGGRRWLIMLDGAEQAGLATPLAHLLARCPQVRWLVATRQRLHLDHEHLLVLDGFPLPDAGEADADVLAANDGVRFLAATIARSGRAPDLARDAALLAAIVRTVDGLPLALDLLGRLARQYTLQQLLDSVQGQCTPGDTQPDALAFGELLPSLLASIRRSWSALSAAEQRVLGRLAVFPAAFELSAARWVAQAELPHILSLVDRSLLRAEGGGRLSLHAAVRACVLALQPQAPAAAEAAYLDWVMQRLRALAIQAKARTLRPLQRFLRDERVHVDHAWALALQRHDHAALLCVQEAVWFLDDGAGTFTDFSARCLQAERLTRADPGVPAALRAMLLGSMARDLLNQSHLPQALAQARLALREARRARHFEATLQALNTLFFAQAYLGNFTQAGQLRLRQEALLRQVDECLFSSWPDDALALLAALRGDVESALVHFQRMADAARRFEDRHGEMHCLVNMAMSCHRHGQGERAVPYEERAFAAGAGSGGADAAGQAKWLSELALWHIVRGDLARARRYADGAAALAYGHPQLRLLRLKVRLAQAAVAAAHGELAAARRPLAELLDACGREDLPAVAATTLVVAARWLLAAGDRGACVHAACETLLAGHSTRHDQKVATGLLRWLGEPAPVARPAAEAAAATRQAALAARQHLLQAAVR